MEVPSLIAGESESPLSRPNLFVIGAMKSGTSSFHDYLGSHPEIFMSEVKEPCHFVPELRRSQGTDWYLNLFAKGQNCLYRGESSVVYTHLPDHPGVVERIEAFAPDAKFIYVMREPVARAVSHYWHCFQSNRVRESRQILDAFKTNHIYLDYSDYALQLKPFLERFGPNRVRAITLEELSTDKITVMHSIFRWLNVDPEAVPAVKLDTIRHITPRVVTKKIRWLSRFRHTGLWNTVGPWIPSSFRRWGKRISEPYSVDRSSVPMDEALQFVREQMAPRRQALEVLLNRDFPEWEAASRSHAQKAESSTSPGISPGIRTSIG